MFASVTTVSTGDEPIESATIVAEEMTRWLRDIEGFEGFFMLSQPGRTLGITLWASQDVAERHRASRMEFIDRMASIAGVDVEQIEGYDVAFAHVGEGLAALARPR